MADNLYLLIILVPFFIALVNLILPVNIRKILTFLALLYGLYLSYQLYVVQPATENFYFEPVFAADQLSIFTLIFIQILSVIILIFSLKGLEKQIERAFFVLYPMTVAFCNGVVISENMIVFLAFWGMSGITLYLFALLGRTADTPQTAKKTFIIVGGSDAFLLMGFVLMGFIHAGNEWSLSAIHISLNSGWAIVAFIFVLMAAFAKAGGFPMHTWVPQFSKDAPVESAAFLPASLDKLLGIYLLARMVTTLFSIDLLVNMIIVTLGALTVITAVMMAMIQHNGRKLLGYHAVSQVGYMIMGVGSGSVLAFAGGLFHMINHTIYKSNLFLTLGSVEKKTQSNNLDDLGGLGRVMPITFIMALIGALSISGIPPFNGFFSKWMIYQGLLQKTAELTAGYQIWMLVCLILAIFGSALTLASFMKFIHAVFLGQLPENLKTVKETVFNHWLATGLLSLLCIVFGIFAVQIPLRLFIAPIVAEQGWAVLGFPGLYKPLLIVLLFLVIFLIGWLVFMLTRNIRYDDVYLGGMSPSEKFRVLGTEFYNEVRSMQPFKALYDAAEKRFFDVYELGKNLTFALSGLLQKLHPGQLQLYLLYILIGTLIFIWVI
ncbi:MAG: hypothetical protein GF313_03630 [Caldithrix sp.]|nr:hypothetical protein [Caldithrix sp.]